MKPARNQAGVSLITAIFLIVMLASLAAAAVSLSNVEQDTGTKSLLSAKVYYGARAGLEWGVQQAIAASSCTGGTWGPGSNPMQSALADVSVTVTCTANASPYGAGNFVYYVTSQATVGTINTPGYAERHLTATVSNIP